MTVATKTPHPSEVDFNVPAGYNIVKYLASGAFGRVFMAERGPGGQKVALKMFTEPRAFAEEVAAYDLVKKLCGAHSGVVCLHESGAVRGKGKEVLGFLAIDYVSDGRDASDYFVERTASRALKHFSYKELYACFADAAAKLLLLQSQDLALRDIKPANMMMSLAKGKTMFIDLGFLCKASKTAISGYGTPHFMSPELLIYNPKIYVLSGSKIQRTLWLGNDIWSLAMSFADLMACKSTPSNTTFGRLAYSGDAFAEHVEDFAYGPMVEESWAEGKLAFERCFKALERAIEYAADAGQDKYARKMVKALKSILLADITSNDTLGDDFSIEDIIAIRNQKRTAALRKVVDDYAKEREAAARAKAAKNKANSASPKPVKSVGKSTSPKPFKIESTSIDPATKFFGRTFRPTPALEALTKHIEKRAKSSSPPPKKSPARNSAGSRRCKTGNPCGQSCISRTSTCRLSTRKQPQRK